MANHPMKSEIQQDRGKIVYTCPICDRCVEVDMAEGDLKILVAGDRNATHRGGVFASVQAEVEQTREPPRVLH